MEASGLGFGLRCLSQLCGPILPLILWPDQGAGWGVVLGVLGVARPGVVPSYTGTSTGSCLMTGVPLLEASEETEEGRDWL